MDNLTSLETLAATHQWSAILPEIFLGCLAVILLFVDLFSPTRRRLSGQIAFWAQIVLLGFLAYRYFGTEAAAPASYFAGMIAQSQWTELLRMFFVFCSIFVTHLAGVYLEKRPLARVEYYHVQLIVTACFMLLVQSQHFISFFVILETLTVGFYILVAYGRNSRFSLEAGLKYLIMGAFSSAILLFGIMLLYGVAGNPNLPMAAGDPLQFSQLKAFIGGSNDLYNNSWNLMVCVGAVMVLTGVAFKIGAVPFQIWIPDVYQGAPTPTTAFLAVVSKSGGFFVLFMLIVGPFSGLSHIWLPLLTVVTIATLLFGNIAALGQRNAKRLMGMSGVAHAGILLMGTLASLKVDWAPQAVLFYLFTYALASFAVFEVMVHVAPDEDSDQDLDRFDALLQDKPFLGGVLLIGLGSLAGIPPLAGFIAKLLIFIAAFHAQLYLLLGVALVGVVISIYYYFAFMRAAVMRNPFIEDEDRQPVTNPQLSARILMTLLAAATVVFGLYQGFLNL